MATHNINPTATITGLHDYMRYYVPFIRGMMTFTMLVTLDYILCFRALPWLLNTIYPPPKPPCPLSKLPMDVLLNIIDHCPAPTQAILANTSKVVNEATKRWYSVKRSDLIYSARSEVVFTLAQNLSNMTPCWDFDRLHPVDTTNTPWVPYLHLGLNYIISHTHVALALKFRRLGIQTEYLERPMTPRSTSLASPSGSEQVWTRAEPRIARGRVILRETLRTFEGPLARSVLATPYENIRIGRLYARKRRDPRSGRPFAPPDGADGPKDAVRFATSCKRCRVDVGITVFHDSWVMNA